jgi:hypothetical protein
MQSRIHRGEPPLKKPDGGFVSISTLTLGLLWWAFAEGLLSLRSVRVGLALVEVWKRRETYIRTERKAGRLPKFTPRFTPSELASLCDLTEPRTRKALRELTDLGVLAEFSETSIRFARSVSEVRLSDDKRSAFRSWFVHLAPQRKKVQVPRRALVLACKSSSRALVAVILGVCIRCSYYRRDTGYTFSGRVSCSWIARRFRVSLRAVRTAKADLVEVGWLSLSGNITTAGELVSINPHWDRPRDGKPKVKRAGKGPSPAPVDTNSAGVRTSRDTNSAGLYYYQSSSREYKNQDKRESLGASAPDDPGPGAYKSQPKKNPENTHPAPRLSNIRLEDLRSTERLVGQGGLFAQAVKAGVLSDCEADLLYIVACAERARTVAAKTPCGLFNSLMKDRRKLGINITGDQEDDARRRIREWRNSQSPPGVSFSVPSVPVPVRLPEPPKPSPRAALSDDAALIEELRRRLGQKSPLVFGTLRAHAGWSRDRFTVAVAELDGVGGSVHAGI